MCDVTYCAAAATGPDQADTTTPTTATHDGDTMDMPEMNTPSISLEVSETAKDDNTVITEDQSEQSVAASSQEDDGLKKLEEDESQPDQEIPVPKPRSRSDEEVPVPKPQPEDLPKAQNSIPESRSSLLASVDAVPQLQAPRVYPKPVPARSKPMPAPRSKSTSGTGKLLPLREKLADNANKLVECPDENTSFVPTAEWVSCEVFSSEMAPQLQHCVLKIL